MFASSSWQASGTAAAFVLALPALAVAQSSVPVIRPGDPALDGGVIEAHRAAWRATIGEGESGTVLGQFERKVRGSMVRGDSALLVIWDVHFEKRSGLDLFALRPRTLEPLFRYVTNSSSGGLWVLNFHGDHVSGSYTEEDGDQPRGFQTPLESRIFAGGGVLDLALAALELGEGSTFMLPLGTLDAGERIVEVSLEVGASELLQRPGAAPAEAWVVDGVWSSGQRQRLWIAREPPYLIRREIVMRDGKRMVWELIELDGAEFNTER